MGITNAIQEKEKKRLQEIKDLESLSRKLCDLLNIENFMVKEVVSESYTTNFTPSSERMLGGKSLVYQGGFTSKLILNVSPKNQNIPIKIIHFEGFSIVKAGDYISAKIPKYETKKIIDGGFYSGDYNNPKFLYFDRNFKAEEEAIELTIFSSEGNILRKDRSINYKLFSKE